MRVFLWMWNLFIVQSKFWCHRPVSPNLLLNNHKLHSLQGDEWDYKARKSHAARWSFPMKKWIGGKPST
ncbi:hypothetical protein IFM89_012458 [Coptis chinensis]|uniref:Uncharacterized protein n=1 Tax=Coptis chinensis TaxID=261450 RepID=A0A835I7K9_9MAGN|nr:hypothetical protein IFM89_012458 [Coptis chinensis]